MGNIDYQSRIPNNVDLHNDRRLQRALEAWLPNYLDWMVIWTQRQTCFRVMPSTVL